MDFSGPNVGDFTKEGCSAQNKMSQVPREGPKEGKSILAFWQSQ